MECAAERGLDAVDAAQEVVRVAPPVRLIRNQFELQDLIDSLESDSELVERDFALVTIAAGLVEEYGTALCFKGGFVLRHVYGHERFSKDIDATRVNPPKNKLDSEQVAETIKRAGIKNLLTLNPGQPATDSGRSLDFDNVRYRGPLGRGQVSVEVSYREDVIEEPQIVRIGPPYFEPFDIPVLPLDEIVAEKLRALAQRVRPTDLSDLAMILLRDEVDPTRVRYLVTKKFELVRPGDQVGRIASNIAEMATEYEAGIEAVAPDAPAYLDASRLVLKHLGTFLP
jgi:predicted nucleotidyltransferase component of viral defense system